MEMYLPYILGYFIFHKIEQLNSEEEAIIVGLTGTVSDWVSYYSI